MAPPLTLPPGTIGEFLGAQVAGFGVLEFEEEPTLLDAGAESAYQSTFSNGREEIGVTFSFWTSPDVAADEASAIAESEFAPAELLDTGDVGRPPSGRYWYFEREGTATVVWTDGATMARVEGAPNWVQEYFVQFPKGES